MSPDHTAVKGSSWDLSPSSLLWHPCFASTLTYTASLSSLPQFPLLSRVPKALVASGLPGHTVTLCLGFIIVFACVLVFPPKVIAKPHRSTSLSPCDPGCRHTHTHMHTHLHNTPLTRTKLGPQSSAFWWRWNRAVTVNRL